VEKFVAFRQFWMMISSKINRPLVWAAQGNHDEQECQSVRYQRRGGKTPTSTCNEGWMKDVWRLDKRWMKDGWRLDGRWMKEGRTEWLDEFIILESWPKKKGHSKTPRFSTFDEQTWLNSYLHEVYCGFIRSSTNWNLYF
jgi:hypothetical protein